MADCIDYIGAIEKAQQELASAIKAYAGNVQEMKDKNSRKMDEIYKSIEDYIGEKLLKPYRQYFTAYNPIIQHGEKWQFQCFSFKIPTGDYFYIFAENSAYEKFYIATKKQYGDYGYCRIDNDKFHESLMRKIIRNWSEIKREIEKKAEEYKTNCISHFEFEKKEQEGLSAMLDSFEL